MLPDGRLASGSADFNFFYWDLGSGAYEKKRQAWVSGYFNRQFVCITCVYMVCLSLTEYIVYVINKIMYV